MAYLVDNPPARSQYRHPRRAKPTGCLVIHSAENVPDLKPPDTGADAVAKFIVGRSDPGSYHVICDSDSAIQLVDFADEAFQDGTGSNPWAIGISGAFQAHQWETLPLEWRQGVVDQMAQACLRASLWLKDVHGVTVPAVQLTREQSEAGKPGLISHALRDPARRSDPGGECLSRVTARFAELLGPRKPPVPKEDDMARTATCTDSRGRRWFFWLEAQQPWARVDGEKFELQPGKIVGDLAAVAGRDGTIDLYGTGIDGRPWTTHNDGSGWSAWQAI